MPRSCSDAFYFALVYEYLVHMGMDSTSRRMLEECDIYGYPIPYLSEAGVSMEEINRLLEYFDDENYTEFFKVFELAVPVNIQNTTDCHKLKLGLHVYFAVTGLRYEKEVPSGTGGGVHNGGVNGGAGPSSDRHSRYNGDESAVAESTAKKNCNRSCPCKNPHCMCRADGGSAEEKACIKSRKYAKDCRPDTTSRQLAHPCMATLLAFLERDGSELSKEPELLPYFALPFILEPEAHPHYEHLFKPPWASNLRRWLWNFLISHRQASRVPELVLLLPDLHSALSGRACRGVSSMGTRTHISCPTSDQEICMNHVTSNMHGKQRLRQYFPKDPNAKPIDTKETSKKAVQDEGKLETGPPPSEVANAYKKPVTFHQTNPEPPERDDREGTAGCQIRCTCTCSNEGGNDRPSGSQEGSDSSGLMYGNLRSRYNQLHSDYHNLLGVAAELTDALENSLRGENVDIQKTLENCSVLFPELMKGQEEFTEPSDKTSSRQNPMQDSKHDAHAPRRESVPVQKEVVVVTANAPQTHKTVEIEASDSHPPPKSNSHTRPHFDHLRPIKPSYDSNVPRSESMNLFCTAPMIPLHLMQESDKARMYILCDLDFKIVKRDLHKGSIKRMLLLLQALRWRLTRTSVEQRTSAIESYIANDLMGIRPDSNISSNTDSKSARIPESASLLERLLMPCSVKSPHPLQHASSRLINAIASLRKGRNYLVVSPSVVDVHVRALNQVELDSTSLEMIIATLQKLSLRASQRRLMIEANLVEWLADQLAENVNNRGGYWLKYMAALFMNLCLHSEARERCVPFACKILDSIVNWMRATMLDVPASSLSSPAAVLLPYIEYSERKLRTLPYVRIAHISPRSLPYLNGVMYSLLLHPEINQKAVEMSLAITLEELIVLQEDPEARCQLHHILSFHREQLLADSPSIPLEINQDVEDGKWVLDLLEDELDATDPVQAGPEDPTGEQLLCRYYSFLDTDSNDTEPETARVPMINLEEYQLPVRSQSSFTPEIPQARSETSPIYSIELPETQSTHRRHSSNQNETAFARTRYSTELPAKPRLLQRSVTPPERPGSIATLHEQPCPSPRISFSLPENTPAQVTSTMLLPSGTSPTHSRHSITPSNSPGPPRISATSFVRTSTVLPETSPANPCCPNVLPENLPACPGHEITTEWSRTAIVFPEPSPAYPKTSVSQPKITPIVLPEPFPEIPRTSIVQPEIKEECSRTTTIILPDPSPARPRTSTEIPTKRSASATKLESPSYTHPRTPSEAPEGAQRLSEAHDSGVGCPSDPSGVMSVSYTKHEQVVRCRTPENFEVIVAVTLSPDKRGEEEQSEQRVLRMYKKIKKMKSPGKESHGVPSESQQSELHSDKDETDVTPAQRPVNVTAPEIPTTDSDSHEDASKSSQQPKSGEITKESIFGSRPRIPRTPPNNTSRSPSITSHSRSPPKSNRTRPPPESNR